MRKLAELWEPYGSLGEKKAKCKVCAHYCVISPGKRGFCRTRENVDGQIFTLVYGSGIHGGSNDPIEKKPLYHFYPGSSSWSIATIGCNFHCKFCQNWDISQAIPDGDGKCAEFSKVDQDMANSYFTHELTPEKVVEDAKRVGAKSISYTYNEPTIWYEFIRDCAKLAHTQGLKNVLVTNGYSSLESNQEFVQFIDAANIDIKAFDDAFYKKLVGVPSVKPVLETCEFMKKHGVLVEITNLIIPNENDKLDDIKKMAEWIKDHLGVDTPLHFSAYFPKYHLNQPPTPPGILMDAYHLAKSVGLYYVYMGNIRSDEGSHTMCRNCGQLLIERIGYNTINRGLTPELKCKECGAENFIRGTVSQSRRSFLF